LDLALAREDFRLAMAQKNDGAGLRPLKAPSGTTTQARLSGQRISPRWRYL
jgi:hypothetical protein